MQSAGMQAGQSGRQHIADNVRHPSTGELGELVRFKRTNRYAFVDQRGGHRGVPSDWGYKVHEQAQCEKGLPMPGTEEAVNVWPSYERIAENIACPLNDTHPLFSRGVLVREEKSKVYEIILWDGSGLTVPQAWARDIHEGRSRPLPCPLKVAPTGIDFSQDAQLRPDENEIATSMCSRIGGEDAEGLITATDLRIFFLGGGRRLESFPWSKIKKINYGIGLKGDMMFEIVAEDASGQRRTARYESRNDDFWYVLSVVKKFADEHMHYV